MTPKRKKIPIRKGRLFAKTKARIGSSLLMFATASFGLSHCSISLPEDRTFQNLLLLRLFLGEAPVLTNVFDRQTIHTNTLLGKKGEEVKVSIDGGTAQPAVMNSDGSWLFSLPTGSQTWKTGSTHTLKIQSKTGAFRTYSLRKGNNRDINADGYSDVAFAALGYNGGTNAGQVCTSLGGPGGALDGNSTVVATCYLGENNSDKAGNGIALGDLNADGYADLAVGAPAFLAGGNSGKVYIYYGTSNGFSASPDTTFTIAGALTAQFGFSLAMGDWDGNGYDDLAVGAPLKDAAARGRVYVWPGGAAKLTSGDESSAISSFTAESNGDNFGKFVLLRDLNGDAKADLIVGAPVAASTKGRVYVWFGSNTGIAGDAGANAPLQLTGESSGDLFGGSIGIGDTNGDGIQELWISAKNYGAGNKGRLYGWMNPGTSGSLAASGADSIISGENAGDEFSTRVYLDDLTMDGYDELFVSSLPYNAGAGANQGRQYIQLGGPSGIATGTPAVSFSYRIDGLAAGDNMGAASLVLDGNGDGILDLFIGASGDSTKIGTIFHWFPDKFPPQASNPSYSYSFGANGDLFGDRFAQ